MSNKITSCLASMLFLSGCAGLSTDQQSPAPVEDGYPPIIYDGSSTEKSIVDEPITTPYKRAQTEKKQAAATDPVVVALVDESKVLQQGGDIPSAVAALERGVRIRPRNPLLWAQLAELRLKQGQAVLAENLARKSLALIQSDQEQSLQAKNWQVIADSLKQQGKVEEASLANQKAKQLQ